MVAQKEGCRGWILARKEKESEEGKNQGEIEEQRKHKQHCSHTCLHTVQYSALCFTWMIKKSIRPVP